MKLADYSLCFALASFVLGVYPAKCRIARGAVDIAPYYRLVAHGVGF